MRCVQLRFDTESQLRVATSFLVDLSPLQHVAVARKSLVQHAIAEMLTAVIRPFTEANAPRCAQGLDGAHTSLSCLHQCVVIDVFFL